MRRALPYEYGEGLGDRLGLVLQYAYERCGHSDVTTELVEWLRPAFEAAKQLPPERRYFRFNRLVVAAYERCYPRRTELAGVMDFLALTRPIGPQIAALGGLTPVSGLN